MSKLKTLQGAAEGASSICEIRRLLKRIPISVQIKYRPKPKQQSTFDQDPKATLLYGTDQKAKATLKHIIFKTKA